MDIKKIFSGGRTVVVLNIHQKRTIRDYLQIAVDAMPDGIRQGQKQERTYLRQVIMKLGGGKKCVHCGKPVTEAKGD